MSLPLQQTKDWEKLQKAFGEETFFVEEKSYQFLAILKKTKFGNYLYLPYGPVLADKNAAKTALKALESLAKEKGVTFIRIEPQDPKTASYLLKLPNIKKSKDLNPAETWCIDLTQSKEEIIAGFSQSTRRYSKFEKRGVSVTSSKNPEDIKYLVNFQRALSTRKNFGVFSEKYLKTELEQPFSTLYLAHYKDPADTSKDEPKIIAASLFFDHDGTRFYMQGATDPDYKKPPASLAMMFTAMMDAKDQGFKVFDFWGIAPDNAPKDHPWAGFTAFKKSFGGYEVDYCGTYDIVLNKTKYKLYNTFRKINRIKRKVLNQKG
jgi:lipid II:glycine glycyltransferase (peptidoglycan interpeptide bridge formation enzyme)